MSYPEPWMEHARCQRRPDLPWILDREHVGLGEEASMASICARCSVRPACADYVAAEDVCSGFWAGDFRDPPPDAIGGAA